MSWISSLCETYDNCSANVLQAESAKDLLPIGHTTQYAQIEITLNQNGVFQSARVLDKNEGLTIIPCTEDSANRTSGLEPHPLFDKLQYVAGDYEKYVTAKDSGFPLFRPKLEAWVNSPNSNPQIRAIYTYICKEHLIEDLINAKILFLDDKGLIMDKWESDSNEKPPIFSQTSKPSDSFVRFRVEIPGVPDSRVWMNASVRSDYIAHYLDSFDAKSLCYVSGTSSPPSRKSASKIRNVGDRAKLISSNDLSGFTFRGRFLEPGQAASLSYEASQKSVNALKWLVAKQGWSNAEQTVVSWGTKDEDIPDINDSIELFEDTEEDEVIDTREEFAARLNKAISGYSAKLDDNSNVVVMGLDSSNGFQGRLSIVYYRELHGSDYLRRIKRWHTTCSWYPLYISTYDTETQKNRTKLCYAAPSPNDIAICAYGAGLSDKLKKATVERLLPCIVDGKPIPRDLVYSLVLRASRPFSMERWEFNKTLGVACALIRKYYNDMKNERNSYEDYQEVWTVDIDENQTDRSYLFGRILAYARRIEEYSLYSSKAEPRQTNAERFMLQFKKRPMKTWSELYQKLLPYLSRFRTKSPESLGNRYEAEMNALVARLKSVQDGYSNEPLSPLYLLGYQSQMTVFDKQIQELKARKTTLIKNDDGE